MPRPTDKELSDLKWLLERLTDAESFCQPYFDRAKRHYRLYRFGSAVNDDDWPYVNRVRSRDILAFIEDSTALLIQTLFATMPFYSVIPRESRVMMMNYEQIDPFAVGDQISRALDYQISHEDTEFFEEIIDSIKGSTIFGNGYTDVLPKFTSDGTYLRPLLKTRDFWDVLPVAGARRMTKAKGVFIREFVTIEDLKAAKFQDQPIYRNLDLLGKSAGADPSQEWHRQLLQEVGMENYVPSDKNIELIHYMSGGHKITFADRKAVLSNSNEAGPPPRTMVEQDLGSYQMKSLQPYPYDMPTVQYKYMPVPLEFFGMGIPEILEVLQEDKNLIRSARRDNIDLTIQKIIKARAGADINYDLLKFYPGAIWPLENLQDVEPWDMKDVTQSSYQEEAMRTQDMENALSLFGYARGMTPQHSEQPTTVMKLQQASLNRLDLNTKLAEFGYLQNIATRIILLTRRFMPQGVYESIIGDQDAGFYRLTEEDIRRFYFFKPVGSSVTKIKELRQQQIQAAMAMVAGVPPQMMQTNVQPFTVDYYEMVKTAFDAIDIPNVDRILIKLQPPQGMMGGGMPGIPGGGPTNPGDMQALANVLYGQGGKQGLLGSGLMEGIKAMLKPPKETTKTEEQNNAI